MSKKQKEMKNIIQNFMIATYGHYKDRGMSDRASLMRVARETYEGIFSFMSYTDVDSKDLVILEHTLAYRDFISKRGSSLVKEENPDNEEELVVLANLNNALKEAQEYYYKSNEEFEKDKRLNKNKK